MPILSIDNSPLPPTYNPPLKVGTVLVLKIVSEIVVLELCRYEAVDANDELKDADAHEALILYEPPEVIPPARATEAVKAYEDVPFVKEAVLANEAVRE